MKAVRCPECGSEEIEAERNVEERGGVFGLIEKDGKLTADVDWSERVPFGSTSYRCLDCNRNIMEVESLIPVEEPSRG